jgi:chromate transporter
VREVAALFLRLGLTAFGGPAAHIALLHEEVVRRRGWLSGEEFADLLGASNLIPGPTSTELALHVGHRRAGRIGFLVTAAAWITPAVVVSLLLAVAYGSFGTLPESAVILATVSPVVVAIVAQAAVLLGRSIVRNPIAAIVGVVATTASLAGTSEVAILALGALAGLLSARIRMDEGLAGLGLVGLPAGIGGAAATAAGGLATGVGLTTGVLSAAAPPLGAVLLTFLKIGALLFGSGYVLVAFLRSDLVVDAGWITERQLLDAVAVGQLTPGPVSSTATFVGYLVAGLPGALVATLGIFLPGALLVAMSIPILPRLRTSRTARAALDGVNAAALGLLVAVTLGLARGALVDPVSIGLAVAAGAALLWGRISSGWLVLAGAAVGGLRALAG